jgi:hypothetical protein
MLDIDPSIDEDEFNRWYFEEHIRERLACRGLFPPGASSLCTASPANAERRLGAGRSALQHVPG